MSYTFEKRKNISKSSIMAEDIIEAAHFESPSKLFTVFYRILREPLKSQFILCPARQFLEVPLNI